MAGNKLFQRQSALNTTDEDGEKAARAAMFFAGLKILQTMNLCFAGSFPVLLRFGIPPKQIGPFIGIAGACLELWAVFGLILGFCLGLLNMLAIFFPAGLSIFTTTLLFLIHCRLAYVCLHGSGYEGVRKYFYWLCFSALVYQTDSLLCPATWGFHSAYFFLAMENTNVLIPVIHLIALLFFKLCGGKDILFWKLCFQLGGMVFFTGVCVVVWIWCFCGCSPKQGCGGYKTSAWGADGDWGTNSCQAESAGGLMNAFSGSGIFGGIRCVKHKNTHAALNCRDRPNPDPSGMAAVISPFFMGILGMGSIFWLFPVVFPFMVCHYSHFEFTQKFLLALGAVATLIVWFIAERNHGELNSVGANFGELKFQDWADTQGKYWNATWFILLPVGFLTWMFFNCLHYPSGYFGRRILYSKWSVVWGCVFFFLSQLFKAFGLNGCFANAFLTAKLGALGNISFMCSMIHLVASLFTNEAYSVGYSSFKCAVDSGCSWPTQGLGGFRSFRWWWFYGIRNGTKRFIGLRRIDVVAVIS